MDDQRTLIRDMQAAVTEQRKCIRDQLAEIDSQRKLRLRIRRFIREARAEFGEQIAFRRDARAEIDEQAAFRHDVRGVLLRDARPAQADAPGVEPAPAREPRVGVAEAAKYLGVDRKTVYGYCHLEHDHLPHEYSKVDGKGKGKLLFLMTEVAAWWPRYQARGRLR
jgi:hypothetical protein